jgi:hypothetical protein
MKREPKNNDDYDIHKIFPLFSWVLCIVCKKEFIWMSGWRFLSGPFYGGEGNLNHVCSDCIPTIEQVREYVKEISNA